VLTEVAALYTVKPVRQQSLQEGKNNHDKSNLDPIQWSRHFDFRVAITKSTNVVVN
jgi:hypothetical protein